MSTIRVTLDRAAVVNIVEKQTNYPAGATFNLYQDLNNVLVCGASSYPDSIKYKEISSADLYVYGQPHTSPNRHASVSAYCLLTPFVESEVTYDSIKIDTRECGYISVDTEKISSGGYWFELAMSPAPLPYDRYSGYGQLYYALKCGLRLHAGCEFATPKSTNKPYFELTYSGADVGLNVSQSYPIGSATISSTLPTTFSWETSPASPYTLEPVVASKAVFRWRKSGASTYTEVNCSSPLQCTIPANTFSGGTIQWQVAVTANSGVITTSDWMTTEVIEPVSSCVALSPANTVLDGTVEQTFVWEHIISNGTAQYAFDLQTSPDGLTWEIIRSEITNQTSTTFAPGTFAAGDLWWRVRTYNLTGIAGSWSEGKRCIIIAAPSAPAITADDTSPRFVLRWQQTGQQAYELMVDGSIIAKTFSAESIYKHNGYLEPGAHKVQVRIQNRYQMWSDWGVATLQIVNKEGAAIQLSAVGENEVRLSWSSSGGYDGYVVYRNGTKIAETQVTSYTDHFAVSKAVYQVRGVYAANGNYTLSNAATVTIVPQTLLIADVSAPSWINLPLSAASLRSVGLSASQSVTYTHYIGIGLPGVEIGEAVSRSYDLDCAFKSTDLERIRQFESLLGKVVCIKTPSQRRIIGVLTQMNARENRFYVTYRVPIVEIKWEETEK